MRLEDDMSIIQVYYVKEEENYRFIYISFRRVYYRREMSSSDYVSLRRMKNMQQLSCNAIPDCHNRPNCELVLHTPGLHNNLQNNVNYCVVPAKCVTNNGRIVSTDLVYSPHNDCCTDHTNDCISHVNNHTKYITKTIKPYKVTPAQNGTVGFLVEKCLPFTPGQSLSCNIVDNESNFFNGVVFDYDKDIGFLSIGNIDNVTGNFSNNAVYNISLILFDPEVIKLKQRMDYLYRYLFQVNLSTTPNYNPYAEQLILFEKNVYNLFMYLFRYNIRIEPNYAVSDEFLSAQMDKLYLYFFNVKLDRNLDFNPIGEEGLYLNTLKNKIHVLYFYLFTISLEQWPRFNPNLAIIYS